MTRTRSSRWADLAGAFAIGAGLVHAAAGGTHGGEPTLVRIFALTALVQGGLGAALLLGRSRRVLAAGIALNVLAVAAWTVSRTVGLPVIDALAGREAVGTQDLSAAALAAASMLCSVLAVLAATTAAPGAAPARMPRWLPVLAVLPAFIGMAAPHAHGGDHEHGSSGEHAGDHAHSEQPEAATTLAADPRLSGADTGHATEEELASALALIDATRAGSSSALTDTAAAEAAGYVWIGDGERPGGFQHYVNPGLLADGRVLDPDAIESLVYEHTPDGTVLVSAMYLLEPGSTMDDVPEVAGDLTVWHDHQNLCWGADGRLAGTLINGECRPGGEHRGGTAPMLHVWFVERECGPFAGIEGHGSTDCAAHEH